MAARSAANYQEGRGRFKRPRPSCVLQFAAKQQQSVRGTTPTRTVSDVSQLGKVVATHQFTRGDIQSLLSTEDPITEAFQIRYTLNPWYTPFIVGFEGIFAPLTGKSI